MEYTISVMTSSALLTNLLTHLLNPWSRVLLEKLIGSQLVKNFLAFYGSGKFITTFTSAHHTSIFWVCSNQSILPHPTSRRSVLILSSHLPSKKYIIIRYDVISLWCESTGREVATLSIYTKQIRMSEITIRQKKANIFQKDKATF